MKHTHLLLTAFFGGILSVSAQLTIPSDGSDGVLNITEDTVIDLSQATTASWDSPGNGNGVYDSEKWAVVFKYTAVNISEDAKVTFKNHLSHAPVVWLVANGVTINGTLSVAGHDSAPDAIGKLIPAEAGPGGFRGGAVGPSGFGAGYGPGSEDTGFYASSYGNPQILPLIGGSGSGANYFQSDGTSGGGGGAILIVAGGNVSIDGLIDANGGNSTGFWGGGGSGGAVRIIAETVSGTGEVRALNPKNEGGFGRIRIETLALTPTIRTSPETIGVPPANPPILWPADNAPKARVVSIDAVNAPTDPTSPLVAAADVAIQNNNPVDILIETRDFPIEGVVQLAIIPKFGERSWHAATRVEGDINVATWKVTTTLPQGFVTLQARATQP